MSSSCGVDGKTEKQQKALLLLHRDVDIAEFDAVIHLLTHI